VSSASSKASVSSVRNHSLEPANLYYSVVAVTFFLCISIILFIG
jgi:hypothetical protein